MNDGSLYPVNPAQVRDRDDNETIYECKLNFKSLGHECELSFRVSGSEESLCQDTNLWGLSTSQGLSV